MSDNGTGSFSEGSEQGLVLYVDDDRALCDVVARYLSIHGFTVDLAGDGLQALELFTARKPRVVVADLRMPHMDGLQFLQEVRTVNPLAPVIITTGFPEVESAISAMRHGAFDYIVKPFKLELLGQKILQAMQAGGRQRENVLLSEVASLHEITAKFAKTHDRQSVLGMTFKYCVNLSKAHCGAILLLDQHRSLLTVVHRLGMEDEPGQTGLEDRSGWLIEKNMLAHNRGILMAGGVMYPGAKRHALAPSDGSSRICVPIGEADTVIGVVSIARTPGHKPLTMTDLNVMTVLASQAGITMNNAHLYESVNQKLGDLSLISTYAEQLIGLMDKDDIITCLFETIRKHFALDALSFLCIQKRQHQFLYWTRFELSDETRDSLRRDMIGWYNSRTSANLTEKQVSYRPLKRSTETAGALTLPLAFNLRMMVALEGVNYGAIHFGALTDINNKEETQALLTSLVCQTRIALINAKLYEDMKENYIRTIKALAIAVDAKDTYTHNHSENVMNIAGDISREMGMGSRLINLVRDAGLLHDIGKIGIPGNILNRPGPLTSDEFNGIMKTHSVMGANIVKEVPFLQELWALILHHHENYDGSGYPNALKGDEIPLAARILRVADAFEAMTSNRPYRNSLGTLEAMRHLQEGRGRQFDPAVVDAILLLGKKKGWM